MHRPSLVVEGAWAQGAWASAVVEHGLSCPTVWEIFLDHRLNWCPLNCKLDSKPLDHQGSPQKHI